MVDVGVPVGGAHPTRLIAFVGSLVASVVFIGVTTVRAYRQGELS